MDALTPAIIELLNSLNKGDLVHILRIVNAYINKHAH